MKPLLTLTALILLSILACTPTEPSKDKDTNIGLDSIHIDTHVDKTSDTAFVPAVLADTTTSDTLQTK